MSGWVGLQGLGVGFVSSLSFPVAWQFVQSPTAVLWVCVRPLSCPSRLRASVEVCGGVARRHSWVTVVLCGVLSGCLGWSAGVWCWFVSYGLASVVWLVSCSGCGKSWFRVCLLCGLASAVSVKRLGGLSPCRWVCRGRLLAFVMLCYVMLRRTADSSAALTLLRL